MNAPRRECREAGLRSSAELASIRVHSRLKKKPPMNANEESLLKEGVDQVVGAALEVLNGLGHRLHEQPLPYDWSAELAFISGLGC